METVFIEATQPAADWGLRNWGKFAVARFDTAEWERRSAISDLPVSLLGQRGWHPRHVWVMDLETCEAAGFSPGGSARADLDKHRIWVCPMFQPFLEWLYDQDLTTLSALPQVVELPAAGAMAGYRREGPISATVTLRNRHGRVLPAGPGPSWPDGG